MMTDLRFSIFENKDALQSAVVTELIKFQDEILQNHPRFHIAMAGGSLPGLLFSESLAARARLQDWSIMLADERCVPANHSESNGRLIEERIQASGAEHHPRVLRIASELAPHACARDYQSKIEASGLAADPGGVPILDLVVLGMGPDGHIASLFPGHTLLDETQRLVAEILDSPKPPPERITLTYPLINNAREIWLVVVGEAKSAALAAALEDQSVETGGLPVQQLQSARLRIFCDRAAAGMIMGGPYGQSE